MDLLTASYTWYTPYQFAGNNPIKFIDLDGLEQGVNDVTFIPRLAATNFQSVKLSVYNAMFTLYSHTVDYSSDTKWEARYEVDLDRNELLNTLFIRVPKSSTTKEVAGFGLDLLNIAAIKGINATDFIAVHTKAGIFESVKAFKESLNTLSPITRKLEQNKLAKILSIVLTKAAGSIKFDNKNLGEGFYDFVVTNGGKLKIGYGHYSLAGEAESVKESGQLFSNNKSKVELLTNYSGHYQPNVDEVVGVAKALRSNGLTSFDVGVVDCTK